MRRILVTAARTPLGGRVAERLRNRADVDVVVTTGVVDGPRIGALIDRGAIDTVIHAGMCPSRSGVPSRRPPDVVSTQQLTAAISGRETPVRVVVAISSSDVYVPRSSSPLWRREDETLHAAADSVAALVMEAEAYLCDLAEHQPHICVSIIRLADLSGPDVGGSLASLWRRPILPYVAGFDPVVQAVHVDDATRAVEHAAMHEVAGTLNVASRDVATWRATARLARRVAVPAPILPDGRWSGLGVPANLADVLRFGRCLDTAALRATGFEPEHTIGDCIDAAARR